MGDKKTKKIDLFSFFYKYFIKTCTQTRGDNTEFFLIKNVFQGMLNIFYILSERVAFLSGIIRDMSSKKSSNLTPTRSLLECAWILSPIYPTDLVVCVLEVRLDVGPLLHQLGHTLLVLLLKPTLSLKIYYFTEKKMDTQYFSRCL